MIPIGDDIRLRRAPVITGALLGACVVVFIWQLGLEPRQQERAVLAFGLVPALITGRAQLPPALAVIPPALTVVTSMFMHGSWAHLAGNLLYLAIFGSKVEDRLGRGRFLLFYLGCGAAAAAAQILPDPGSRTPMIGASGAISGVLGAYLVLFPRANVVVFIPFSVMFIHHIQAVWMLGLWFFLQLLSALFGPGMGDGVAWYAHLGGFIAGAFLALPLRKRRARYGPWG